MMGPLCGCESYQYGKQGRKEVVQLYYRAPQGVLGKPLEVLGAFAKTELLGAGQSQVLRLKMPVNAMASYDDLGKIQASAYVLEAGNYSFRIGTSVRNTVNWNYEYQAAQTVVTEQLERKCARLPLNYACWQTVLRGTSAGRRRI